MDFDVGRLRSSTICPTKLNDEKKLETPEERKEREKAERKARMEANRLKKSTTINEKASIFTSKSTASSSGVSSVASPFSPPAQQI